MKTVKKIVSHILMFLNSITKKRKIIIFNSFPDYSDNALTFYNYIKEKRTDIIDEYKIIWTYNNIKNRNFNSVKRKSLKGLYYFLHSKYIICTHGYSGLLTHDTKNQVYINLWHGCGYKKLNGNGNYNGDYSLCTSNLYKNIQGKELNINPKNMLEFGFPRNDDLKTTFDFNKIGVSINSKKLIWLPTFRKSDYFENSTDGSEKSLIPTCFTSNMFKDVNDILIENNMSLIIKLHPLDCLHLENINFSNIRILTNEEMRLKNINFYSMLGSTDCLLSDYSSVIVDYLKTNKPIFIIASDMEEYENSSGFVFDNINDYLPGPIISSFDELIESLKDFEKIAYNYKEKRDRIKQILNPDLSKSSSELIANYFFGDNRKKNEKEV